MNLQEWRKKRSQGDEYTLPSGLTVYLKKVGVLDLAGKGQIPATLEPQLNELMQTGKVKSITIGDFAKFAEMIDTVAKACIVQPAELDIEELPYEDRVEIFQWANAQTAKLQPFRKPEAQPLEPARPSNHLSPASE